MDCNTTHIPFIIIQSEECNNCYDIKKVSNFSGKTIDHMYNHIVFYISELLSKLKKPKYFFNVKYFYKNEWCEIKNDKITEMLDNKIVNKNIFKLQAEYDQESDWINILENIKELKKNIDKRFEKYKDITKIDKMQLKKFTNDDESDCELNSYEHSECYYIELLYNNKQYYIIIKCEFDVAGFYSDRRTGTSKLTDYTIETNFDKKISSKSEMIGCILESYNETCKITNYNITFTEFDYK